LTESDKIGFVVCGSCGARIKADRNWCLRCHEPLRAFKKSEIPLPSWVRALGGGTLIFALVGIAAVGVVAYVSLDFDTAAQDAPARRASPQAAAPSRSMHAAAQMQASDRIEQVTFVDAPRRSTVLVTDTELADARTRYEQALERDPKNADTLNNLGLALERLGFVDSAVVRFSEAVNVDRRNWIYHFNLAHAMALRQDWNHAATEYGAALEIFPGNFPAQYNMAIAFHLASNEPEAVKAFEKAVELAPGDPASHLSLAISLEASGHPDDALNEYRRYLQMVPTAQDATAVNARIRSLSHDS